MFCNHINSTPASYTNKPHSISGCWLRAKKYPRAETRTGRVHLRRSVLRMSYARVRTISSPFFSTRSEKLARASNKLPRISLRFIYVCPSFDFFPFFFSTFITIISINLVVYRRIIRRIRSGYEAFSRHVIEPRFPARSKAILYGGAINGGKKKRKKGRDIKKKWSSATVYHSRARNNIYSVPIART